MELALKNGFEEVSMDEAAEIEGGSVIAGTLLFVGGVVVGYVVDGGIKYFTGKSAADWVAYGLGKVFG